jgi:hypothetical protein
MPTKHSLSHEVAFDILETADIGGTNAATPWVSMAGFKKVLGLVQVGTWNVADAVTTCRLEQATSGAGAGSKELTTSGAGANYDTGTPVNAIGEKVVLEAQAEDFDTENGFTYVRLYAAATGNTGVDNVSLALIRYDAEQKYEARAGAAAAGAMVYVRPS